MGERLPDHSSLTRLRERYGLEVFRRFFAAIVERCAEAGLVWGQELYSDATKIRANASTESVPPRCAVAARAHLDDLFAQDADAQGPPPPVVSDAEPRRIGLTEEAAPELAAANTARHDWVAQGGQQERTRTFRDYVRTADYSVRTTDPAATPLPLRDGVRLGYQGHDLLDGGKARLILGALATPGVYGTCVHDGSASSSPAATCTTRLSMASGSRLPSKAPVTASDRFGFITTGVRTNGKEQPGPRSTWTASKSSAGSTYSWRYPKPASVPA